MRRLLEGSDSVKWRKGMIRELVHQYGDAFAIFTPNVITSSTDNKAGVDVNVLEFLYDSFMAGHHKQTKERTTKYPSFTLEHEPYTTLLLGDAAKFHYAEDDVIYRMFGIPSLAYFVHTVTGVNPTFVKVMITKKINALADYDKRIADVVSNSNLTDSTDLPLEIQQLKGYSDAFKEFILFGDRDLEERVLVREVLRGLCGIRHPLALNYLVPLTPSSRSGEGETIPLEGVLNKLGVVYER